MEKPAAKAAADSLRDLRQSMGQLRDADVTAEHLLKWKMPAALKEVARAIAEEHAAQREGLETNVTEQLGSASMTGTMLILARGLELSAADPAQAETRLAKALDALVKKRRKQLRRSFGDAAKKQTAASLHAARIAVKKLRYLLELSPGDANDAKGQVRMLKQFLELLGDHHDAHVIAEELETHLKMLRPAPKGLMPAWNKWAQAVGRGPGPPGGRLFRQKLRMDERLTAAPRSPSPHQRPQLMRTRHRQRPIPHRKPHPLGRSRANIPRRQYPRQRRLQRARLAILQRPLPRTHHIRPRQHIFQLVPRPMTPAATAQPGPRR